MAFTYGDDPNPTGTTAQKRDFVRVLLRDTVSASSVFTDAQIDALVLSEANVFMAAALLADTLVGASAVKAKQVGRLRIEYLSQQAASWRARGWTHQKPYAGGTSLADKQTHEQDTDSVAPAFTRDLHDHPDADDVTSPVEKRTT